MTYKIEEKTFFRATVAHGFIRPVIGFVITPDLKPEDIWSYHAGIESDHFKNIHAKADVFYHRQDKTLTYNYDTVLWFNGGVSERTGFELNATVSPLRGFTAEVGLSYIWVNPFDGKSDETYNKDIFKTAGTKTNFFVGVCNLFNGSYYWFDVFKNPQRWVEAGLRIEF